MAVLSGSPIPGTSSSRGSAGDDRGGIEPGHEVSVPDYVSLSSHTHDINDIRRVYLKKTVIADHARITYHATVLAGAHTGKDGMVGAMALATGRR